MGHNPRIMVVKKPKPGQSIGLRLHLFDQRQGRGFALREVHSKQLGAVVMADEIRVVGLPIAVKIIETVQAGLKEIRPGAHLGENHEIGEAHLSHQIRALRVIDALLPLNDWEIAHQMRAHPLIFKVL